MDYTTPAAIEFRTKLEFNQYDLIMTKEQLVLTKIFPKHILAMEVDEKGHKDQNEYKEVEKEKAIKEHLNCKFIRINHDEKGFDMYFEIGKICSHNKPSKNR